MKKLLTLLSAATVAIGLYADDFATGTSFEDSSCVAGLIDITTTTDDLGSGTGFWATNGTANVALTIVSNEGAVVSHQVADAYPSQFAGADNAQYLHVETTFGNAVDRFVRSDHQGQPIKTLQQDGLYFDSLVKFTAFDECPTNTPSIDFTDAKIAVWVQEEEVVVNNATVTQTNLYVRAGGINGDPVNYNCGSLNDPEGWHRLTIKAIRDVYQDNTGFACFVVFVDTIARASTYYTSADKGLNISLKASKYSAFYNGDSLFPSLDQDNTAAALTKVSFDGQGDIDDIVFTDTVPSFAKDGDNAFATFGSTPCADAEALRLAVNGATALDLSTNTVVFWANYAEGAIEFANILGTINIELNGRELTGLISEGPVCISQNGTVGGLSVGTNSVINAGTYGDGEEMTIGAGTLITGGKFRKDSITQETINGLAFEQGKGFVSGTGDDADFWIVGDATYPVEVNGVGYNSIAEALAAATAGQTVTLNADVTADAVSTAAGTIDLNGKTLTLSGTTAITFTGTGAKTLKGGDLMGVYHELTVTVPAGENLTFDSMTFHASVMPNGSGDLLTATNCQFLCDFDKTGTAFTDGSSADVHSYGLLFNSDTLFAQADVVNNYFDQGRRAAVQASIAGDLYFYGNTVVADKLTSRVDGASTRYPALQIISNGGVFIENNSFSGQYLGEAFCVYNKGAYRTTDAPIVFSGNTVANDVTYLWGIYDADASGAAALVNPDIYFGANTIGANVDLEHCIYKTTVDGIDMNGVTYTYAQNLALPAGVASVYAWTHAAGAKPYYVNGAAADAIAAGTVIAVPGVEVTSDTYVLTPDATFKNQYTAVAGEAKVGSTPYLTFKDAVDAADTGDTVTVLKDCSVTNGNTGVTFTKGINLVNNYTITIDGANYALRIANGTTTPVTWSGTGSLVWAKGSGSPILVGVNEKKASYGINDFCEGSFVLNGGYLTSSYATAKGGNLVKLEAGTFTLNDGTINGGTRGVKADSEGNNATCVLTINGGTIVNTNSAAIAASTAGSGSSTITVNAGTFTGAITGDGMVTIPGTSTAKFDRDQTKFCATGYKTVLSDGWYVVQAIPSYTITFISGEGSTTNEQTVMRGDAVAAPPAAEVTGKTFSAWDPAVVSPAAGNATYRATYTANSYNITYMDGETVLNLAPASYTYGTGVAELPTTSKEGYTFNGWYLEAGFVTEVTSIANNATGAITLYAKFTKDEPTVPTIDPAKGGSAECGTAEAAADAAAAINADKATYITAPEGIDTAAYYSKVEAKVVGTSVVLGIAESAEAGVKTAAETSAADVVAGEATAITVAPGLYYKVSKGTSLPIVDADPITGRSTTGTTTTVTKPGTTQGFIKVEVDAKPFDVVE